MKSKRVKTKFFSYFILIVCVFVGSDVTLWGQKHFAAGELVRKDGSIIQYKMLEPRRIKASKKYPLVIFFHGAGERGVDNQKQLVHGSKLFEKRRNRRKFPAYVVFPQCPVDDYWAKVDIDRSDKDDPFRFDYRGAPTTALKGVFELIQYYLKMPTVDPERIYIMGLSMGGMGVYEAISRHPEWFAAAIPICGGGDLAFVPSFAEKVPIWAFHGALDDVVPPKYSRDMMQEIIFKGGFPRYTEYPDANHNAWDRAFADKNLLPWLFEHKKKQ
jgi:predicted peptidase